MLPEDTRYGFVEFSRRKGDFAIAMALVTYRLEVGTIIEPCVAIGGAEPHARRIAECGMPCSTGRRRMKACFQRQPKRSGICVDPMEDINNTAAYRRGLVRTLVAACSGACSMNERREITLNINGERLHGHGRTTSHAGRRDPRRLRADGHAYRLRAWRLRGLHCFT